MAIPTVPRHTLVVRRATRGESPEALVRVYAGGLTVVSIQAVAVGQAAGGRTSVWTVAVRATGACNAALSRATGSAGLNPALVVYALLAGRAISVGSAAATILRLLAGSAVAIV